MFFRKISLIFVLLFSVLYLYGQGSTVEVMVANDTPCDYTCSVKFCQDVTPSSGNMVFTVPAWSLGTTQIYEFDNTDICLESIKCYYSNLNPVADITVSPGPIITDDVANCEEENPDNEFSYVDFQWTSDYEYHEFNIDE